MPFFEHINVIQPNCGGASRERNQYMITWNEILWVYKIQTIFIISWAVCPEHWAEQNIQHTDSTSSGIFVKQYIFMEAPQHSHRQQHRMMKSFAKRNLMMFLWKEPHQTVWEQFIILSILGDWVETRQGHNVFFCRSSVIRQCWEMVKCLQFLECPLKISQDQYDKILEVGVQIAPFLICKNWKGMLL